MNWADILNYFFLQCLPYTWYDLQILHVVFFFMNAVMWACLFHASTTDPGFLPRNIPEYDMAIKQVDLDQVSMRLYVRDLDELL